MINTHGAKKPLAGLRILEIGQFIAVPAAAQILSDLGANVIKLEPPGGDAARQAGWSADAYGPMFSAYNRGKRSVALDLADAGQRQQARRLALSCDVVLANTRPGALEKVGLGAEQLRPEASFIDDLKADSLAVVELVLAFEQEFKITIPEEDTEQIKTVKDAVNYIKSHAK